MPPPNEMKIEDRTVPRYFVVASSFAAPFFSDRSTSFVSGNTPGQALAQYAANYSHPFGLYAAALYASADAYHSNEKPLVKWLCNFEQERIRQTAGLAAYLFSCDGDAMVIDDRRVVVKNPKGGSFVAVE